MSIIRSSIRLARPFSTALPRLAGTSGPGAKGPSTKTADPSGTPQTTQGHTTTKSEGLDVQSDNANAAQKAKNNAQSESGAQPIDAARMNGGEGKSGTEGKGPFKDQVGGQPGGGDVQEGGKTEVPSGGWTGKVSKALGGNKAFHTSARSLSSPRKPVESDLQGEQNEHLKHKDASDKDSGKGNAAPEPHLPSQQANKGSATATKNNANPAQSGKASGAPKGFVAYHTSAVRWGQKEREGPGYAGTHTGEPNRAGKDAPPEALPPNLESNYNRAEATPPAPPNMTPSSEAEYSSTATDQPNQALKEAVKQGGQSGDLDLSRNAQPNGDVGKKGVQEAWKDRK